ncbi:hypothetical protein LINGRAHAP2_LOCUS29990 [Linum grandiflorum]
MVKKMSRIEKSKMSFFRTKVFLMRFQCTIGK